MTKYQIKKEYSDTPIFVDAEIYKEGMEDGFSFYSLTGDFICYMTKEDLKTKAYPKANRIPVIKYEHDEQGLHIIEGDYIVTLSNGDRYPCNPFGFEKVYEKVE